MIRLAVFPLVGSDVLSRQRRYLVFTPSTQYGVFGTVSIPLPQPDNLVNMAWFFEASYYNVDNSTWFEPLLGDIEISRNREKREGKERKQIISRSLLYTLIESILEMHGYVGRPCLLRSICETTTAHFSHNGLLGDVLHLILTPSSSSEEEDLEDCYYEAEYRGLEEECDHYYNDCTSCPLNDITMFIE